MRSAGPWIGGAVFGATVAILVAMVVHPSSAPSAGAGSDDPGAVRAARESPDKPARGHRRGSRPAEDEPAEGTSDEPDLTDPPNVARDRNDEPDDEVPPECVAHVRPYRHKLNRARAELRQLEQETRAISRELENERTYGLTKEMLAELADRCELRWDHPKISVGEPPHLSPDDVAKLGLDRKQAAAVSQEMAAWNQHMLTELRGLYAEVTGDDNFGSLTPEAMFAEVTDKSEVAERKRVFQRLSAERAGWMSPPASLAERTPLERLYRLVTGAGDRLQDAIGERVGGELAKRMRELHNGYGSTYRSRHGCP